MPFDTCWALDIISRATAEGSHFVVKKILVVAAVVANAVFVGSHAVGVPRSSLGRSSQLAKKLR